MKLIDKLIGTEFTFPASAENETLYDVTIGKVYSLAGADKDGDLYFIDDKGEKNYAGMDNNSHGEIA